jgi:hypothetical protein
MTNDPAEHQITGDNGITFTHERLSMLFDGTNWITFAYDALGRCVKRVKGGWDAKYIYYDGERELLECGSGGGPSYRNVYGKGVDEIVTRTDTTLALTYYFQQDHEGSVTHLTNGSGTVIGI